MMVIKEAAIVRCRVCLLIILAIVFCGSVGAQPLAFSSSASDGSSGFVRTSAQKGVATSTDLLVIAMPVATLAGVIIEGDWQGLKQGALSAVTAAGATLILKYAVKEERPDHSNMHSFPSGHTAVAFTNATFLQRRYGWKFGVPAYAVAAYVGWGRVFSKKHHWWDVLAGAAIGAGASFIYTRPFAEKHNLSIVPSAGPEGVSVSMAMTF